MTNNPGHSFMLSAMQAEYWAPAVQYTPIGQPTPLSNWAVDMQPMAFELYAFAVIMLALWLRFFWVPKWARILRRNRRGVTSLEYALIAALIAVVLIVALGTLGQIIGYGTNYLAGVIK